ncbi:MAG: HNH endonuclease family protein, partial [Campylobacterota bacterium]|nr:HNH endonuclease family protein [Campylobacterota bacterium]
MVKNFILMNLRDLEQAELYTRFWQEIEKLLNNDEDLLLTFLQHYLTMKLEYVISKSSIYDSFEKYFNLQKQSTIYLTVKDILEDLLEFSKIYHRLFLEKKDFEFTQYSLNHLNIKSYYPLLLKVEKYNNSITNKVSIIIENYLIRRIIIGLPPGKTKNVFAKIIKNIEDITKVSVGDEILKLLKEEQGQSRYPNDIEFSDSIFSSQLYANNKTGTKYILYKIEYYLNTKNRSITIPYSNLTIEHILPETEYSKLPECWTNSFDVDLFDQYIHTLGNLTLVT